MILGVFMNSFSVLMSVYSKEIPEFFEESINSLINQSLLPDQIVIVKDGKLTHRLEKIIDRFCDLYPDIFKVISLEENVGLGKALSIGLKECKHDLVARMDTDDICASNRFERQIAFLESNKHISVLGSWIAEFDSSPDDISSIRNVPVNNIEIRETAKSRNPLNHMSVMFRKSDVLAAGNYQTFLWNEDYHLWVRMMVLNFEFANIPETLLYVRAGQGMIKRRGGIKYLGSEIKLQRAFVEMKFISKFKASSNIIKRIVVRFLPSRVRGFIYKRYLRI